MKTLKITKRVVTLVSVAVLAGFTACTTDTVEYDGGKLPDRDPLENNYGKLRSNNSTEDQQGLLMTEGAGFTTDNFCYSMTQPASADLTIDTQVDPSLVAVYNEQNKTNYLLLPVDNYEFPDGKTLLIEKSKKRSAVKRVKFLAGTLAPGEYILPLTVASDVVKSKVPGSVFYYTVTVRARQLGDYELNTPDSDPKSFYLVFYINTKTYQPLLVQDYLMVKKPRRGSGITWNRTIGNLINLRTVTLDTDKTGRALLNLGSDMRYVLDHATKYIRPLQDQGRKVCLTLEGGGTGLGFCNLSDQQIADFVAQAKAVVETYELDGINLWDQNSGYGKDGMPAVNTTSYPKLIVAMHDMLKALGDDKMLTVTDHEKPTEYFWDTEATGGIEVGQYLDYAWSGYRNGEEKTQILDPWHPDALDDMGEPLASKYTHKAFAGLDPSKYGCINVPWYAAQTEGDVKDAGHIATWVMNGYKQSNILVFEDLRTALQDAYEGSWGVSDACGALADDGPFTGSRGFNYTQDQSVLSDLPDGNKGYNKWLKDW